MDNSIWIAFYKSIKEVNPQLQKEIVKHIAWAPTKEEIISKLLNNSDSEDDVKEVERFKKQLDKYEEFVEDGVTLKIKKINY